MHSDKDTWLNTQPDTRAWLDRQFARAERYQKGRGIQFDLTFDEYVDLWTLKNLKKVASLIKQGRIGSRMRHPDKGWVLSWSSKAARSSGVMDKSTARVLQRQTSKLRFYLQAGDKHTEAAKKKIGDAKRGKPLTQAHRQAISEARTGVSQTEEHKRKRIENMKATKAKNRLLRLAEAA